MKSFQRYVQIAALVLVWGWGSAVDAVTIAPPQIPAGSFDVTRYGAVGDGKTVNTEAIAKAIEACRAAGGGTVVVPAGRFVTGPFALVNNLNLHLEKGAVLALANDLAAFPMQNKRYVDAIVADQCHDVAITGPGTIDGQGQPWWEKYKKHADPGPQPSDVLPHRPNLIVLNRCNRVLVQDVSIMNSPMFHLVPRDCLDVTIERARFEAPEKAINTDGIDPSGRNYLITGCYFDVGDDCIAVKPQRAGEAGHLSCEDITVEKCTFRHGHGMSVGGQTPGGLRRMTVRDCTFDSTEAGIRLKAPRGSGGLVEDLTYENLKMTNVKIAIYITSYYPKVPADLESEPAQPVTPTTPIWRHIRIRNVTAEGGEEAGRILGLPEMPVADVALVDVNIAAARGMRIVHAKNVVVERSSVKPEDGKAFLLHNAEVAGIDAPP